MLANFTVVFPGVFTAVCRRLSAVSPRCPRESEAWAAQAKPGTSADDALESALVTLEQVCDKVAKKYNKAVTKFEAAQA